MYPSSVLQSIRNLFRSGERQHDLGPAATRVPDGQRVYVVGDIHGELACLDKALEFILEDGAEALAAGKAPVAIFLGDYVDRGARSREVIDRLCGLAANPPFPMRFLAGNHEAAMLAFLDDPVANAVWLRFGGLETLVSYGILAPAGAAGAGQLAQLRDLLDERLPGRHRDFLGRLEHMLVVGDYAFVHAGVRPGIALDRQSREDLLWIREDFTDLPRWHGKRIVHGHTIEAQPAVHSWRIGIDTGAYASGALCCLILDAERVETRLFRGRPGS